MAGPGYKHDKLTNLFLFTSLSLGKYLTIDAGNPKLIEEESKIIKETNDWYRPISSLSRTLG